MKSILQKAPSYILFVLLAIVYLGCGYIVGYHQGYKMGQEDYIIYMNKIFEGIKVDLTPKEEKKEEKKEEEPKAESKTEEKKEVGLPKNE